MEFYEFKMLTALQEDIPENSMISSFDYLVEQLDQNDTFDSSKQILEHEQNNNSLGS